MASRERSPALRIGIISDTHGSLDPRAYAALADCDHIIHAGDICGPAILREMETLAPVTAVLGNNDYDEYGSEVGHFAHPVLGGVRFLVGPKPGDVRERFAGSEVLLKGCNDLLVLTKPEAIRSIHEAYLQAGAHILSTESIKANAESMAANALQENDYEINRAAAALARCEADRFTLRNPSKPRCVAGSMGPTNRTASI